MRSSSAAMRSSASTARASRGRRREERSWSFTSKPQSRKSPFRQFAIQRDLIARPRRSLEFSRAPDEFQSAISALASRWFERRSAEAGPAKGASRFFACPPPPRKARAEGRRRGLREAGVPGSIDAAAPRRPATVPRNECGRPVMSEPKSGSSESQEDRASANRRSSGRSRAARQRFSRPCWRAPAPSPGKAACATERASGIPARRLAPTR